MADGAVGLKASCSGRICGVAIAKPFAYRRQGSTSHSSLSVKTVCGVCNVKAWVWFNDLSTSRIRTQEAVRGKAKAQKQANSIGFGVYGLKACSETRIDARQTEAARKAAMKFVKEVAKLWIRVFPTIPVTKKPTE